MSFSQYDVLTALRKENDWVTRNKLLEIMNIARTGSAKSTLNRKLLQLKKYNMINQRRSLVRTSTNEYEYKIK